MKKNTHFQGGILKFPQMENLISKQKNNHAGRGRGLQLAAIGIC
jgi:hypothetical protein